MLLGGPSPKRRRCKVGHPALVVPMVLRGVRLGAGVRPGLEGLRSGRGWQPDDPAPGLGVSGMDG